jgi:class 3 adenylate cyclase
VVALLFLLTVSLVLFGLSIIGPWKRMMHIQQLVTAKFVPYQLLSLMGFSDVSQVERGKGREKKITTVAVDVCDFGVLLADATHDKQVIYLNEFVAFFSSSVLKHSGFVDRCTATGFVAIFTNASKAAAAVKEIRASVKEFNIETQAKFGTQAALVSVGMHTGKAFVATVGSHERINTCVIGTHSAVVEKLHGVSARLKGVTLTTKNVAMGMLNATRLNARRIGRVFSDRKEAHDVYQMLGEGEEKSLVNRSEFNEALTEYEAGFYDRAKNRFKTLSEAASNDTVCGLYALMSQTMSMRHKEFLGSLNVDRFLSHPIGFAHMHKVCTAEYSTENIECWALMKKYESLATFGERRVLAQQIWDTYFALESGDSTSRSTKHKHVNIAQHVRDSVEKSLTEGKFEPDMFRDARTIIAFLMNDTFARVKREDTFTNVLAEANLGPACLGIDD